MSPPEQERDGELEAVDTDEQKLEAGTTETEEPVRTRRSKVRVLHYSRSDLLI